MSKSNKPRPRLPRCLPKYELAAYFGVTTKTIWGTILTDQLLEEWGFDQEEVKPKRIFGPRLSRRIYEHYKITDLDADFSEEIKTALGLTRAAL